MSSPARRSSLARTAMRTLSSFVQNPTVRRLFRTAAEAAMSALDDSSSRSISRRGGRPVSNRTVRSQDRARRIAYCPQLDGQADPGEIVWAWVEYEEHNGQGKDRPVLVVGRDGSTLLGLMLSSQSRHAADPEWLTLGKGPWDSQRRTSYVRLDRVLEVPEDGIRREGAILDEARFSDVAEVLRTEYGWQ